MLWQLHQHPERAAASLCWEGFCFLVLFPPPPFSCSHPSGRCSHLVPYEDLSPSINVPALNESPPACTGLGFGG